VVVGAPFLPLAILFYWVANNLWTLGQQRVVYNKIDREEAEKATQKTETQRSLAPKVGQKPDPITRQKKPGAKPITSGATSSPNASSTGSGSSDKSSGKSGASDGSASSAPSPTNGVPKANGSPPSKKVADESGARAKAGDRPVGQRNGRPSAPTKRGRKR
jgi:YidC/Oxa1 family membrane protein insertase